MPHLNSLIHDCSDQQMDMEQCARCLCLDFNQLVTPAVGGQFALANLAATFKSSMVILLGTPDKKLRHVLFYSKQAINTKHHKMMLVRFASALARGMNLSMTAYSPLNNPPRDFDSIFSGNFSVGSPADDLEAKETPNGGLTYIALDLNRLIQITVGTDLLLPEAMDECQKGAVSEVETPPPSGRLSNVSIDELRYDKESGRIVRDLFCQGSTFLPCEVVKVRKNCIAPDHNDSNPSMDVSFHPLSWRKSSKVMNSLSAEDDKKLEQMYYSGVPGNYDNSFTVNNRFVILYMCRAKCYSTKCRYLSVLNNDQIKLLR